MITQLRPFHSPEKLAELYAKPHEHHHWSDHQLRVGVTIQVGHGLAGSVRSAADLSCGDGAILSNLRSSIRYFGDYAPGHQFTGPVEETINQIPHVDLFVLTETLEHVEAPGDLLKAIRPKCTYLLLSTPLEAWNDKNEEHYWAYDREGVQELLAGAGFQVAIYNELDIRPAGADYCYGIFGCV